MNGAELIATERDRQQLRNGEHYTSDDDDRWLNHELARLAAAYATPPLLREHLSHGDQLPRHFPARHKVLISEEERHPETNEVTEPPKYRDAGFPAEAWKPMVGEFTLEGRIRELVKAGALIAAEIDRLQRPAAAEFHKTQAEREAAKEKIAPDPTDVSGDVAALPAETES